MKTLITLFAAFFLLNASTVFASRRYCAGACQDVASYMTWQTCDASVPYYTCLCKNNAWLGTLACKSLRLLHHLYADRPCRQCVFEITAMPTTGLAQAKIAPIMVLSMFQAIGPYSATPHAMLPTLPSMLPMSYTGRSSPTMRLTTACTRQRSPSSTICGLARFGGQCACL